jgi:hypothetical protein
MEAMGRWMLDAAEAANENDNATVMGSVEDFHDYFLGRLC